MRGFRGDFLSAAIVLATVGALAAAFPFDAMSFRPRPSEGTRGAFAAFVSLTPAEEAAAMKAAKSAWNAESGGVRHLRAELFSNELPEAESEPALGLLDRLARQTPEPIPPGLSPYLPSQAAPPAKAIPAEKAADEGGEAAPAFSREELLRID